MFSRVWAPVFFLILEINKIGKSNCGPYVLWITDKPNTVYPNSFKTSGLFSIFSLRMIVLHLCSTTGPLGPWAHLWCYCWTRKKPAGKKILRRNWSDRTFRWSENCSWAVHGGKSWTLQTTIYPAWKLIAWELIYRFISWQRSIPLGSCTNARNITKCMRKHNFFTFCTKLLNGNYCNGMYMSEFCMLCFSVHPRGKYCVPILRPIWPFASSTVSQDFVVSWWDFWWAKVKAEKEGSFSLHWCP